jgi:Yip1 domain
VEYTLDEKRYEGRLARIEKWLDSVTDKNLIKGAIIVILTGIFAGGAAFASSKDIPIPEMVGALQTLSLVGAVVITVLGWIISTLIYHASAHLLGGSGDKNRMFALSGYASIPVLIQQFLRFIEYWFLDQSPQSMLSGLPELLLAYLNVFSIIGIVFMSVAIRINYGLTGRKAVFVALIPTMIGLAFAVVGFVM